MNQESNNGFNGYHGNNGFTNNNENVNVNNFNNIPNLNQQSNINMYENQHKIKKQCGCHGIFVTVAFVACFYRFFCVYP